MFCQWQGFQPQQSGLQKQTQKIVKKRISLGALSQSTHIYSPRVVFNSKISTARLETQVQKDEALQWYSKWASFKSTSPDMTYAQALLKNSGIEMLFLHL